MSLTDQFGILERKGHKWTAVPVGRDDSMPVKGNRHGQEQQVVYSSEDGEAKEPITTDSIVGVRRSSVADDVLVEWLIRQGRTADVPHMCPHCRIVYSRRSGMVQHLIRALSSKECVPQDTCSEADKPRFTHERAVELIRSKRRGWFVRSGVNDYLQILLICAGGALFAKCR
jgi:hypothetical protein